MPRVNGEFQAAVTGLSLTKVHSPSLEGGLGGYKTRGGRNSGSSLSRQKKSVATDQRHRY